MPHVIRMLCAIAIGASTPGTATANRTAADTTLKKETLGSGIYLFRAPSDLDKWTATNVVVVINDEDVVVFDSNTRPVTARMVIAEIRKLTPKPVRTLINSHWHMDHWSGNDEYVKAFPGIQIIASTETRDYMKRMSAKFFQEEVSVERARAALDSAIRTGMQRDGTPLTADARRVQEAEVTDAVVFAAEVTTIPRVLPTMAFRDTLVFWRGRREFRLIRETGDATGSTVMYLPGDHVLVTGDVLVSPEDGNGPPPWTTTNYAITPWLVSLRSLDALDVNIVVPGQGPAFHDKAYLHLTAEVFASVISQVHGALERGLSTLSEVQAVVNVDSIGLRYTPDASATSSGFKAWVATLVRKVHQEALDGAAK